MAPDPGEPGAGLLTWGSKWLVLGSASAKRERQRPSYARSHLGRATYRPDAA